MSQASYARKKELFRHALWLGVMPAAVYLFFALLLGSDADTSAFILFGSLFTTAITGGLLGGKGYPLVVSAPAAVWPVLPASAGHWFWALGFASPGPSSQALVRALGWTDASMTAALVVLSAASACAGWTFMLFNRWYKRKTGHSLFEES